MANHRMFSKSIIDSDAFLDMPLSAQALYFHLNMRADDDGFVGNPRKIQRMIGSSDDDMKLLIMKRFILVFDTGVIVIKHWRMHNLIRKDRHKPTVYQEELAQLGIKENGSYTEQGNMPQIDHQQCVNQLAPNWHPNDTQLAPEWHPEDKLSKDKISKVKDSCPVQEAPDPPADVEALILNDKTEWKPTQEEYMEYKKLYPSVDVKAEFRKMRGWLLNNPKRRKTKSGIRRFVNSWLAKEQDQPRVQKISYGKKDLLPEYMTTSEPSNQPVTFEEGRMPWDD